MSQQELKIYKYFKKKILYVCLASGFIISVSYETCVFTFYTLCSHSDQFFYFFFNIKWAVGSFASPNQQIITL